jgi:hypothetical protein
MIEWNNINLVQDIIRMLLILFLLYSHYLSVFS